MTDLKAHLIETARTAATLCEHGISFAPGCPCGHDGTRSAWCGECFEQCECGQLVYVYTSSASLPLPIRGAAGVLHTCAVPS